MTHVRGTGANRSQIVIWRVFDLDSLHLVGHVTATSAAPYNCASCAAATASHKHGADHVFVLTDMLS